MMYFCMAEIINVYLIYITLLLQPIANKICLNHDVYDLVTSLCFCILKTTLVKLITNSFSQSKTGVNLESHAWSMLKKKCVLCITLNVRDIQLGEHI